MQKSVFIVPDRRKGNRKVLELAKNDDLDLVTRKGAEQSIVNGENPALEIKDQSSTFICH